MIRRTQSRMFLAVLMNPYSNWGARVHCATPQKRYNFLRRRALMTTALPWKRLRKFRNRLERLMPTLLWRRLGRRRMNWSCVKEYVVSCTARDVWGSEVTQRLSTTHSFDKYPSRHHRLNPSKTQSMSTSFSGSIGDGGYGTAAPNSRLHGRSSRSHLTSPVPPLNLDVLHLEWVDRDSLTGSYFKSTQSWKQIQNALAC